MKLGILRHIISQPFVASTSIAALVHSTWSLCTFMGGDQPTDPLHLVGWLLPGFLLAFSLDVGLLWTAVSINRKEGGKGMYAAMGVLLLAMFYLQWLYMAIHLPEVSLGAGVRQQWIDAISFGRDMSLFVVPALLPISVGLFTFSRRDAHQTMVSHEETARPAARQSVAEFRNASELVTASNKPELPELPAEVWPEALRNDESQVLTVSEPEQEAEKLPFLHQRANGKH